MRNQRGKGLDHELEIGVWAGVTHLMVYIAAIVITVVV